MKPAGDDPLIQSENDGLTNPTHSRGSSSFDLTQFPRFRGDKLLAVTT